jgi:hypothetical protein
MLISSNNSLWLFLQEKVRRNYVESSFTVLLDIVKFELVDVHFKRKNFSCCKSSLVSESVVRDLIFALEDEILHDIESEQVAGVDISG